MWSSNLLHLVSVRLVRNTLDRNIWGDRGSCTERYWHKDAMWRETSRWMLVSGSLDRLHCSRQMWWRIILVIGVSQIWINRNNFPILDSKWLTGLFPIPSLIHGSCSPPNVRCCIAYTCIKTVYLWHLWNMSSLVLLIIKIQSSEGVTSAAPAQSLQLSYLFFLNLVLWSLCTSPARWKILKKIQKCCQMLFHPAASHHIVAGSVSAISPTPH